MRVGLLTAETITLHSAVATLPVPTSLTAGGDVTPWKHGDAVGYSDVDIEITADKATTLAVSGGAIALYRVADGRLSLVALLNNGSPIVIQKPGTPVVGFCQYVALGAVADRLVVGGYGGTCTPTDSAVVTVRATPIESR